MFSVFGHGRIGDAGEEVQPLIPEPIPILIKVAILINIRITIPIKVVGRIPKMLLVPMLILIPIPIPISPYLVVIFV